MAASKLWIPDDLWARMLSHVMASLPDEACGLVGGVAGRAQTVIEVENADHSPLRYRMDPAGQVNGLLAIEGQGLELVAIYHSHPRGPGDLSSTDLAEYAYPEAACLIWSPGPDWMCRGYDLSDGKVRPVSLVRPDGSQGES